MQGLITNVGYGVDTVEKGVSWLSPFWPGNGWMAPSTHDGLREREQLCELAQILGGGCEEELVFGAAGSS